MGSMRGVKKRHHPGILQAQNEVREARKAAEWARRHPLTPGRVQALSDVSVERDRQEDKWGAQNHPDLCPTLTGRGASSERHAEDLEIPTASRAKFLCGSAAAVKELNWATIAVEEVAEAVEAAAQGDLVKLREELVQSAAVFIAWIEALDRRTGRA